VQLLWSFCCCLPSPQATTTSKFSPTLRPHASSLERMKLSLFCYILFHLARCLNYDRCCRRRWHSCRPVLPFNYGSCLGSYFSLRWTAYKSIWYPRYILSFCHLLRCLFWSRHENVNGRLSSRLGTKERTDVACLENLNRVDEEYIILRSFGFRYNGICCFTCLVFVFIPILINFLF
jgi:hypothetical protein